MSFYSPTPPYTIEHPFGNVVITIPSAKELSIPLVVWTLMWLILFPWLGYQFLSNVNTSLSGANWVLMVILLGGILFRVYPALYLLAWQIAGKETLEITPQSVKVTSRIMGIGRPREYEAEHLKGIRVVSPGSRQFSFLRFGLASFEIQSAGPIALVYKGKLVYLGLSLGYNSGKAIVDAIHQHLPQYKT
jgi:hypothetical protein